MCFFVLAKFYMCKYYYHIVRRVGIFFPDNICVLLGIYFTIYRPYSEFDLGFVDTQPSSCPFLPSSDPSSGVSFQVPQRWFYPPSIGSLKGFSVPPLTGYTARPAH